jgi:hypothetical protein
MLSDPFGRSKCSNCDVASLGCTMQRRIFAAIEGVCVGATPFEGLKGFTCSVSYCEMEMELFCEVRNTLASEVSLNSISQRNLSTAQRCPQTCTISLPLRLSSCKMADAALIQRYCFPVHISRNKMHDRLALPEVISNRAPTTWLARVANLWR